MKSIDWSSWLLAAVLVFLFWPWAIGVIDIAAYIVTGAQVSGISWRAAQGVVAICWPIALVVILLALSLFAG